MTQNLSSAYNLVDLSICVECTKEIPETESDSVYMQVHVHSTQMIGQQVRLIVMFMFKSPEATQSRETVTRDRTLHIQIPSIHKLHSSM